MAIKPHEFNLGYRLCVFLHWALLEGSWKGMGIDGGDLQDKALELGLVVKRPATEADCLHCEYTEPGDDYFELIPDVSAALGLHINKG